MKTKTLSTLKLVILGEKDIGKSPLIEDYLSKSGIKPIKNENYTKVSFIKILPSSEELKIQIKTFNEKTDKINSAINESHCVLILFDMGSRKSFENLLEEWLIFLRDTCNYKGVVFIFGKHLDKNKLLKTDEKEINQMIKISEVDCSFFNIADKSVEDIRKAIDDFNPDIVYSEFNISAIIATKLENRLLFASISYPTQTEYSSSPKHAKGLKKFLKENSLPDVYSALDLFKWADKSFVPSIYELEPIENDNVTFCGTWKDVNLENSSNDDNLNDSKNSKNIILVYMGNGTISPKKMMNEIKNAFVGTDYEVYIASLGLEKQEYENIHVDKRWDFSKLLNSAVLFINHGGQNSMIDGLIYGVPQLICPGRVFERIYNGKSVENLGAAKVLNINEFKSEIIRAESEKLINDNGFRENSKFIGDKLKSFGGIECILDAINEKH